jgi:hypothetical protein
VNDSSRKFLQTQLDHRQDQVWSSRDTQPYSLQTHFSLVLKHLHSAEAEKVYDQDLMGFSLAVLLLQIYVSQAADVLSTLTPEFDGLPTTPDHLLVSSKYLETVEIFK